MKFNNKFFTYSISILLILVIIFLLGQISYILIPLKRVLTIVLFPFIGAALIYYLLRPMVRYLEKKGMHRGLATIGIFIFLIGLITLLTLFGGEFFKEEFRNFSTTFSNQLRSAQKITQNILREDKWWIFSIQDLEEKAVASLELGFRKLGENITNWISTVANISTVIALIPFVAFFLLKDERFFYENIVGSIPKKHKQKTIKLLRDIDKTLSLYITGQLIVAMVLGVLTYVGYLIIGLPNALILSLFSMLTSIIPFLGPLLGVLPAIFIGLTIDYFMIVKILIVLVVVQQLEGNVVSPNIMGTRLHIHPLTVVFLVIIAISLYGFVGAFIAVPAYGVVRVIFRHFLRRPPNTDLNN